MKTVPLPSVPYVSPSAAARPRRVRRACKTTSQAQLPFCATTINTPLLVQCVPNGGSVRVCKVEG